MVEVFKTNVNDPDQASMLIEEILKINNEYKVNFDLQDRDRILRVESFTTTFEPALLIQLLNSCGFEAEILPDEISPYYLMHATAKLA